MSENIINEDKLISIPISGLQSHFIVHYINNKGKWTFKMAIWYILILLFLIITTASMHYMAMQMMCRSMWFINSWTFDQYKDDQLKAIRKNIFIEKYKHEEFMKSGDILGLILSEIMLIIVNISLLDFLADTMDLYSNFITWINKNFKHKYLCGATFIMILILFRGSIVIIYGNILTKTLFEVKGSSFEDILGGSLSLILLFELEKHMEKSIIKYFEPDNNNIIYPKKLQFKNIIFYQQTHVLMFIVLNIPWEQLVWIDDQTGNITQVEDSIQAREKNMQFQAWVGIGFFWLLSAIAFVSTSIKKNMIIQFSISVLFVTMCIPVIIIIAEVFAIPSKRDIQMAAMKVKNF